MIPLRPLTKSSPILKDDYAALDSMDGFGEKVLVLSAVRTT